ncbi:hypothetical protein HDU93_009796 [Gonapodya sp. JEL0774]|nr:hypothetical protein HDU93_009796 [Gonapodya sp. JEL0774]
MGPGSAMWHKRCLTFRPASSQQACGKSVDSTTLSEKEGEAYCKSCYGKNWGPKGYGFSGGGAGLMSSHESLPQRAAPTMSPSASTDKIATNPSSAAEPASNSTSGTPGGSKEALGATRSLGGSSSGLALGGGDTCPKCAKRVYFAEQVLGPRSTKWHKLCFRCSDCNKVLDAGSTQEAKEKPGEVFCKGCYAKNWGPKGYGFAGGGAFMATS